MGVMNVVDIWTPIGHDQNVHHNIFEIGDGAVSWRRKQQIPPMVQYGKYR